MKLIPFILAIVILFTSCSVYDKAKEKLSEAESAIDSKSEEYLEKYDPKSLAKDEAEEIFVLLKEKDTQELINLFCQKAASYHNLEREFNDFFDNIDGDIESYEYLSFPNERLKIDKNGDILDSSLSVTYNNVSTNTGKVYEIGYYQQRKYPQRPDIEGIHLFCINIRDERNILIEQITVGDVYE